MRTYLEQERHEQRMNDLRYEVSPKCREYEEESEESDMIFKPKAGHVGPKPLDVALELILASIKNNK